MTNALAHHHLLVPDASSSALPDSVLDDRALHDSPDSLQDLDWLDDLDFDHHDDDHSSRDIDDIVSDLQDDINSNGQSQSQSVSQSNYALMSQMLVQSQQLALSAISDYSKSNQSSQVPRQVKKRKSKVSKVSSSQDKGKKRRLRKNKKGRIPKHNPNKRRVALARKRVNGRFVSSKHS